MFILKLTSADYNVDFINHADFQLQDGGFEVPMPKKKQVWGGDSIFEHGAELIASTYENREFTVRFNVKGTTRDSLLANVTTLERLFQQARTRSIEQIGTRVELQYQWDGASRSAYFEVIDGNVEWPDTTMSVEGVLQTDEKGKYVIRGFEAEITVFPLAYPISPVSDSPTATPISNPNGTDVTTGLRVWNRNDLDEINYVEVDGADLIGEQELLAKLELEHDSGEAEKTAKVYIGCRKGDLTFKHVLEDNAAALVFGSPSPTADADFSSGDTYTTVVFADTDGETELFRWDLTPAEVAATQGPFRMLGRARETTFWDDDANWHLEVKYSGTVLYSSEIVSPLTTTVNLLDFGTIYLPPWLVGTPTNLAGLSISLVGERKSTGSTSLSLDYIMLMPQDGGYRILEYRGVGASQFEDTVDDGWERAIYHRDTSDRKTGLPYGIMRRITLTPGKTQRLYFLMEGTAGSTEITRQLNVILSTVPTYLMLG